MQASTERNKLVWNKFVRSFLAQVSLSLLYINWTFYCVAGLGKTISLFSFSLSLHACMNLNAPNKLLPKPTRSICKIKQIHKFMHFENLNIWISYLLPVYNNIILFRFDPKLHHAPMCVRVCVCVARCSCTLWFLFANILGFHDMWSIFH